MKEGRIRVLYICHTLGIGGAEEMILNLVTHLPVDRWEAQVCCIHSMGPIGQEIRDVGYPITTLGRIPGFRDPLAVLRVVQRIRSFRPHIVQTFLLTANLYGRLAAMLARVPIIISTEVNVYRNKKARHIVAERLLAYGTDAVVTSAASVKEHYVRQIGMAPTGVKVIYNAVNWEQIQATAPRPALRLKWGLAPDALVAGIIARLTEQKGHAYLLEALVRTPELNDLIVLIVGDGPLRKTLEAKALALGLGPRVKFLGARRDLGDLLSMMDIFVLPSLWEGLPLSLILAMGTGLPVITTTVDGIPEIVTDQVTGLLVPPVDAGAIGKALTRLVSDAAARERLGRAAREFVLPRFNISHYVWELTELYERLLKERAA